jgi:hypothetical protein
MMYVYALYTNAVWVSKDGEHKHIFCLISVSMVKVLRGGMFKKYRKKRSFWYCHTKGSTPPSVFVKEPSWLHLISSLPWDIPERHGYLPRKSMLFLAIYFIVFTLNWYVNCSSHFGMNKSDFLFLFFNFSFLMFLIDNGIYPNFHWWTRKKISL